MAESSSSQKPPAEVAKNLPAQSNDTDLKAGAEEVSRESGVPMLPGDPREPVGPEDALGEGPKRGDYSGVMRLEAPHEAKLTGVAPGDDNDPSRVLESQAPRVGQVGDVAGKKGGVETADESAK